jgi:PEGA domain
VLEKSLRELCRALAILGLLGFGAVTSQAQAMAESGTLTSNSAVAAQSAKAPSTTMATPAVQSSSPHLLSRTGPPPSELNRKDFEDNAGENAGRVLFRSVPDGAEIFINDLVVGRTPLLLDIAPGKYKVEMHGPRQETGGATVGVLSKETQTVMVNLKQRYPASISIH